MQIMQTHILLFWIAIIRFVAIRSARYSSFSGLTSWRFLRLRGFGHLKSGRSSDFPGSNGPPVPKRLSGAVMMRHESEMWEIVHPSTDTVFRNNHRHPQMMKTWR